MTTTLETEQATRLSVEEMVQLGRRVGFWQRHEYRTEIFNIRYQTSYNGTYRGIDFCVSERIVNTEHCGVRGEHEEYELSAVVNNKKIGHEHQSLDSRDLSKFFYEVQGKFEQQTDTPTSKLPETQEEALKYARSLLKK